MRSVGLSYETEARPINNAGVGGTAAVITTVYVRVVRLAFPHDPKTLSTSAAVLCLDNPSGKFCITSLSGSLWAELHTFWLQCPSPSASWCCDLHDHWAPSVRSSVHLSHNERCSILAPGLISGTLTLLSHASGYGNSSVASCF